MAGWAQQGPQPLGATLAPQVLRVEGGTVQEWTRVQPAGCGDRGPVRGDAKLSGSPSAYNANAWTASAQGACDRLDS